MVPKRMPLREDASPTHLADDPECLPAHAHQLTVTHTQRAGVMRTAGDGPHCTHSLTTTHLLLNLWGRRGGGATRGMADGDQVQNPHIALGLGIKLILTQLDSCTSMSILARDKA